MQIYHWDESEAMRDYYPGHIMVLASSLEEAREAILSKCRGGELLEVKKDLEKEPCIIGPGEPIMIQGSC